MHAELHPQYSSTALWVRLLLQIALIAWAFWYTRPDPSANQPAAA
jgi:uncharacterized membrane protein